MQGTPLLKASAFSTLSESTSGHYMIIQNYSLKQMLFSYLQLKQTMNYNGLETN